MYQKAAAEVAAESREQAADEWHVSAPPWNRQQHPCCASLVHFVSVFSEYSHEISLQHK